MACAMRSTYLSFCPTVFSSPVEKERAQVFFLSFFFLCVFCCVSPPPPLFFSPLRLSALRFPYREGVEGAFVFFL